MAAALAGSATNSSPFFGVDGGGTTRLCQARRPSKEVYAFELPRVSADGTLALLFAANGVQLHLYRNGEDVVPLVPRLLHTWQHPAPLIEIGKASLLVPNVEDHFIERVIEALGDLQAGAYAAASEEPAVASGAA